MKYFADSIVEYILDTTEGKEGTFRFVLPAYPSGILLRIGNELTEKTKRNLNQRVLFNYGIAYQLGKEWQRSGEERQRQHFAEIRQRGWYNESDNLTSMRNKMRDESATDCLIIVLAGYEYIHDKESLRDFSDWIKRVSGVFASVEALCLGSRGIEQVREHRR